MVESETEKLEREIKECVNKGWYKKAELKVEKLEKLKNKKE